MLGASDRISEEAVLRAVSRLREMGASEVYVFGSAVTGRVRGDSDLDMAVSGLPARVWFSAISQASDLAGRQVDLVDLDEDIAVVRYLWGSGGLVRVSVSHSFPGGCPRRSP